MFKIFIILNSVLSYQFMKLMQMSVQYLQTICLVSEPHRLNPNHRTNEKSSQSKE